jgi:hypothetical protein
MKNIRQNLLLAFRYNFFASPIAAGAPYPPNPIKKMRSQLGKVIWALAAIAIGACSKSTSIACSDAGVEHEDLITVTRGTENGPDFDQCVSGQCDALCDDARGKPGNGSRVQIVTCTRTSIDGVDAAATNDGGTQQPAEGGSKVDASVVVATSVSLDITYVVFSCSTPG